MVKDINLLNISLPESLKEPDILMKNMANYTPTEIGETYCNKPFYMERKFKNYKSDE